MALLTTGAVLAGATLASGAVGDITYQSCITGDSDAGGACTAIPSAVSGGGNSGLDTPRSAAVSADGASLYLASLDDDAVAHFNRTTATGVVTYQDCITGETQSGETIIGGSNACAAIVDHTSAGQFSGLDSLQSIVVSADGKSLYAAASGDDAVARFSRNTTSGVLTYEDCITGSTNGAGSAGATMACANSPDATGSGASSGLNAPQSLALSPDGASLYAAARADDAVAHFSRNTSTGVLTYQDCYTGNIDGAGTGGGGTDKCTNTADATSNGAGSGLNAVRSVAVSADGKSLYTAAEADDAVARFNRDTTTGVPTYQDCITGNKNEAGSTSTGMKCTDSTGATATGADSGLDLVSSVAVSADGKSLYAASLGDAAVARFNRDTTSGALTYQDCITGETASVGACAGNGTQTAGGGDSGLDGASSVSVSLDRESLYAAAGGDAAVARFSRTTSTGVLAYQGCITGDSDIGPAGTGQCAAIPSATAAAASSGLDSPQNVAITADGTSLYVPAGSDAGVARFDREVPPPDPVAGPADTTAPETTITKGPKKKVKSKKKKAKFKFGGEDPATPRAQASGTGLSFECKLDKKDWKPCSSPKKVKVKAKRKFKSHKFKVRATDAAGNTDPTPAKKKWKVKRKR